MRKMISAALCVVLLLMGLCVAEEIVPNDEAFDAAQAATAPGGLTGAEMEAWRQGYAMGYYAALHPQDTLGEYVLNTSSHKFHYPSCQSAASISPKNREIFHGSRDDLIANGYSPCGICKP